ncbi:cupin RMLC-type domain [Acanthamoeba polyphaga mimivirus]|uniref:Cupin RMLC-type domain n=4 Tax=Megamimivirinae TaxID=3044648 RepID=A0A2L2DJY8_MIMIV|nr:putative cupin RMLC-type domain protein [Megavirus chiliensis]AGD92681.1 putative cupin RMLC-type domain protein [Megavirus lba]AUV58681.1 cupin RMLC-type domain protein [Bandra megavirus]AVG46456.1 cupin RMLC-type domain [Acanthamoeba polyphaga mimivirus]AVL94048.1 putative cupin RMLC-type domain protein [Megavirus vitis]AEQ32655.1 cupin RMLC-type domain-containing protein [Megavirus chiliensis]
MNQDNSKNEVFTTNINKATIDNNFYRKVINTSKHQQLVLMSLKPNEDIEFEIHPDNDQFIRIEQGNAVALIGPNQEKQYVLGDDDCIIIPAGTYHRIVNTSDTRKLKLYTIYSPPHHPPGTINIERPNSHNSHNNNNKQTGGDHNDFKSKYYKYKYKYAKLANQMN